MFRTAYFNTGYDERKGTKIKNVLKDKKDKIKDFIKYIKNNSEGIKVYKEDWYMGPLYWTTNFA